MYLVDGIGLKDKATEGSSPAYPGPLSQAVDMSGSKGAVVLLCTRWMYFFAIWPILWMAVSFIMNKLFAFIEWWFYREALFYLDSVRRTARGLIFMCLVSSTKRSTAWHAHGSRWCLSISASTVVCSVASHRAAPS